MSQPARTIQIWSFYMIGLGLILLIVPNLLLSLFGIAPTSEVWIRVIGVIVLVLGYYYFQAARHELTPLFHWSVTARILPIVAFSLLVVLASAPPQLILFGLVDLLSALWTRWALGKTA